MMPDVTPRHLPPHRRAGAGKSAVAATCGLLLPRTMFRPMTFGTRQWRHGLVVASPAGTRDVDSLPALIDQLLKQAGWTHVDQLVVTQGPGSFTGMRAGLAMMQGLAIGWPDIRAHTVNTLSALALTDHWLWLRLQDHQRRLTGEQQENLAAADKPDKPDRSDGSGQADRADRGFPVQSQEQEFLARIPDRTIVIPSGTGDYYVGRSAKKELQRWMKGRADGCADDDRHHDAELHDVEPHDVDLHNAQLPKPPNEHNQNQSAFSVVRLPYDAVVAWLQDHPHDRLIMGGAVANRREAFQRLQLHAGGRCWHIYHAAAPFVLPWWSQEASWDTMDKPVYLDLHETRVFAGG